MVDDASQKLEGNLQQHSQQHLLRWWPELSSAQQQRLAEQIDGIDFDELIALIESHRDAETPSNSQLARRAEPPGNLIGLSHPDDAEAIAAGEQALKAGRVGAILVAGGQGSRLGFDHAKGMFPIGPVSQRTLFQIFAEQLIACARTYGTTIPYFVMTSDTTHDETVAFFESHSHFGLNSGDFFFFQQRMMPAVDAATGRILMDDNGSLALSPDGHGGLPAALQSAGLFDEMRSRGIEHLYYHQVDNPAAVMCDPRFIGHHIRTGSEFSTKVVDKVSAEERMGVLVTVDDQTRIIEYIDFPPEIAAQTESDGRLRFRAGNTAMHVFERDFLERLAADADRLPFHASVKKVAFLNDAGNLAEPDEPNAWKFERFIFDALPLAKNAMVLETDRAREFLPVKNKAGTDSPATCREGLARLYADQLTAAGATVQSGTPVEISPLVAEALDVAGRVIDEPTVFDGPKRS